MADKDQKTIDQLMDEERHHVVALVALRHRVPSADSDVSTQGKPTKLSEYFAQASGTGVLATADSKGNVDAALYAKPHFLDNETVAFIMADRLSHANLQSNPNAVYLFTEASPQCAGKRLHLTKIKEETDKDKIDGLRRRKTPTASEPAEEEQRFLVSFRIDRTRPLTGKE